MDGLKDYLFKHWLDWVYALAVIYSVFCAVGLVLGSYVLINLGFIVENFNWFSIIAGTFGILILSACVSWWCAKQLTNLDELLFEIKKCRWKIK